jgi:tetratricopeptide (TPR) repeat protein
VYYARGRSYYELKKKANAVQDLEKALEYIPNNEDAKNWLTKARALP